MHTLRIVVERRAELARLMELGQRVDEAAAAFAALPPLPDVERLLTGPYSGSCERNLRAWGAVVTADVAVASTELAQAEESLLRRECAGWLGAADDYAVQVRWDWDADLRICYVGVRPGFTDEGEPYKVEVGHRRLQADICLSHQVDEVTKRLINSVNNAMGV